MAGLLELYREMLQSMEECKKGERETDSAEIKNEDAVTLPEHESERRGLERLSLSGVREPSCSSTLPEQEWRGSSEAHIVFLVLTTNSLCLVYCVRIINLQM